VAHRNGGRSGWLHDRHLPDGPDVRGPEVLPGVSLLEDVQSAGVPPGYGAPEESGGATDSLAGGGSSLARAVSSGAFDLDYSIS